MKKLLTCTLGLLLSGVAVADEVRLKSGRVLEDVKATQVGQEWMVTRGGVEFRFSADEVADVKVKKTLKEEYQERLAALDKTKTDPVLALADWCKKNNLKNEAKALYKDVLALDPSHGEANREVGGRIYHDGQWMDEADYYTNNGYCRDASGKQWITLEAAAEEQALKNHQKKMEKAQSATAKDFRLLASEDRTEAKAAYKRIVEQEKILPGVKARARRVLNSTETREAGGAGDSKVATIQLQYSRSIIQTPIRTIKIGSPAQVTRIVRNTYADDGSGRLLNSRNETTISGGDISLELPEQQLISGATTLAIPSW